MKLDIIGKKDEGEIANEEEKIFSICVGIYDAVNNARDSVCKLQ